MMHPTSSRTDHPAHWALIPVKTPAHGKSRLAGVLEHNRRAELVERMLKDVVAAVLDTDYIDRVLVVSPVDPDLPPAVLMVRDQERDLISALDIARRAAVHAGARRLLVLAADLPLLMAVDVEGFIERAHDFDVAIAVDRAGAGTNALWLPAAVPFKFRYGADSARRHRLEARARGLSVASFNLPALNFDIDTRDDLCDLVKISQSCGSRSLACAPGVAL